MPPPEGDSTRLALALYASTAHANTPPCDLDLLYHDGRAHRLDKRLLIWLSVSSPRRLGGSLHRGRPLADLPTGDQIPPRYLSDHPESEVMAAVLQRWRQEHVLFLARRDGEAIILDGGKEMVVRGIG